MGLMEENVPCSSQTQYDMIPYVQLSLQGFCKCSHFDHLVLMVRVPPNTFFFQFYSSFTLFFNARLNLSK